MAIQVLRKIERPHALLTDEEFHAVVDALPVMVWVSDADGTPLYFNQSWLNFTGMKATSALYTESSMESILYPDDRQLVVGRWRRTLKTGVAFEAEARMRDAEGIYCWQLIRAAPLRDSFGRIIRWVGACTAIQARKELELALRANEERTRYVFKHVPNAIAVFDRDMRYLLVSDRYLQEYRIKEKNIIGRSYYEIFPYITQRWRDVYQRSLQGAIERSEADTFSRQDGSVDIVRWESLPWRYQSGEIGGVLFYTEVITERKKAEEALRRSEEQLQLALEAGNMATIELDLRTGVIARSFYHERLFGYEHPAPVWTLEMWMRHVYAEDREVLKKALDEAIHQYGRIRLEFRVVWPDGSVHWLHGSGRARRDSQGNPLTIAGALINIDQLKKVEMALQQTVATRDEFLSIASHELKNPLGALALQLQLLQKNISENLERDLSRQRRLVDNAVNEVGRVNRLLDELLDLGRIRAGRFELAVEPVELGELARELVERFEKEAEDRGSTISLHVHAPVKGHWDRSRIEQVLTNLLSNAVKYGNGKPIEVNVFIRENGQKIPSACISVRDHGIGMTKELENRIFRRFERGVPYQRIKGLGLGLYISQKIVETLCGSIWVKSAPGVGSEFFVCLPLKEK